MTLKTSCFNGTLFSKTLRRFWPLWVGYLLIWLLALPAGLHTSLRYMSDYMQETPATHAQGIIYSAIRVESLLLTFCMAPAAAMAVFSGLYEGKRAGVFASLPIRREGAFLSLMKAGLLPLLAVPLITAGCSALVMKSAACLTWTPILCFLGITELYTICFYGFAVFCAQLTGQLLVVPAVYVVLEFTAPVVEYLFRALLSAFIYGYETVGADVGTYLSPFTAITRFTNYQTIWENEKIVGWTFSGWRVAVICAVSGLLLLIVSLLLYRARRTETAGDTVAVRPLKKVFSAAMGLGCALVLSVGLYAFQYGVQGTMQDRYTVVLAGFLIGGFIGYFGAEMLMRKTFRVFGGCLRGGVVLLAGLALIFAAMQFDILGLERRLPDAKSVSSVELFAEGENANLSERENIDAVLALNEYILDHRAENSQACDYVRIRYRCGDKEVMRVYNRVPSVYEDSEAGAEVAHRLEAIYNSREAMQERFPSAVKKTDFHYTEIQFWQNETSYYREGSRSVTITPEQAWEWYTTCILPDAEEGRLGKVTFEESTAPESYNAECWLEIYQDVPPNGIAYTATEFKQVRIQPTAESIRTNQWLTEHGVELHTESSENAPAEG